MSNSGAKGLNPTLHYKVRGEESTEYLSLSPPLSPYVTIEAQKSFAWYAERCRIM